MQAHRYHLILLFPIVPQASESHNCGHLLFFGLAGESSIITFLWQIQMMGTLHTTWSTPRQHPPLFLYHFPWASAREIQCSPLYDILYHTSLRWIMEYLQIQTQCQCSIFQVCRSVATHPAFFVNFSSVVLNRHLNQTSNTEVWQDAAMMCVHKFCNYIYGQRVRLFVIWCTGCTE